VEGAVDIAIAENELVRQAADLSIVDEMICRGSVDS